MPLFKINLIFNITNVKNKSNILIENVCTFDNFLDLLQSNHGSPFSNLLFKISNSHLKIYHQICQRCRLPKLIILQSTERCSRNRGFNKSSTSSSRDKRSIPSDRSIPIYHKIMSNLWRIRQCFNIFHSSNLRHNFIGASFHSDLQHCLQFLNKKYFPTFNFYRLSFACRKPMTC